MGMSKQPCKCKFCPETFGQFRELRTHAAIEHQGEYTKVKRWLDVTTGETLKVLEARAKEGMKLVGDGT